MPKTCAPVKPQNEAKGGVSLFEALYSDPAERGSAWPAITGFGRRSKLPIATKFAHEYQTYVDIGTATWACIGFGEIRFGDALQPDDSTSGRSVQAVSAVR